MCLWQNVERCNLSLLLVEIIMPSQKEGTAKTFTTTMSSMQQQEGWQYYW